MAHKNAVAPRTAQEHRVVRALHAAFMTMTRQFDADLQREHGLSHTEYIAMDFLAEAPDRTLGLSDLAARCQQSLSAISRTVGRLQTQGLVRREQSTRDARACVEYFDDALTLFPAEATGSTGGATFAQRIHAPAMQRAVPPRGGSPAHPKFTGDLRLR